MAEANQKKLYRLPDEGPLLGICAGLADYFKIDATLVRLGAIVLLFLTEGLLILAYLIAALVIPSKRTTKATSAAAKTKPASVPTSDQATDRKPGSLINYLGLAIVVLGAWLLLRQLFPESLNWEWDYVWPVALIGIGLLVLVGVKGKK